VTYRYLTVEVEGAIALVTLNRPEKRNALSKELRVELREVAEELDGRDDLACVLVTGAGPVFCGGADVGQPDSFGDGVPLAQARRIVRQGADLCAAWERLRTMTIAVVNGPAIGGGMSLAVSCDFRVMAPGAYFLAPEVDLGINYSWNSLPRIGNLVGPARAKLIGGLARRVDAETALAWGLCEEVADDPMAAARVLAAEIEERPRLSQQMVKESVNRHFAMPNSVYLDQDQILLMMRDPENKQHAQAVRDRLRASKSSDN
jgi:enoyl-CoA hydratase/carnithine racemase